MNLSAEEIQHKVFEVIAPWRGRKGGLIPILQGLQAEMGYVAEPAVKIVSKELKIPMSEIYSVATFYAQFHLTPRGQHIIRLCRGTACHVQGSGRVAEQIEKFLQIKDGETTSDVVFTLEYVMCLGCCSLAPVMLVDDEVYGRLTPEKAVDVLEHLRRKQLVPEVAK